MAEKTDNVQYQLIKHRTDMHTNNIFPELNHYRPYTHIFHRICSIVTEVKHAQK